jgi:uncharacterized RDD family membrane protein YckC
MSGTLPGLTVDSVTGIDVSLPLAGPGARAYAFLVDWHIRLVLGLAWYAAGALLYNGGLSLAPPLTNEALWFGAVVAPALAIYFLYHYVVEVAMHGSTPGKRMAGVRVVARDGGIPGAGALLARNVFRLVDCLPVFYCVGLIATVVTREHLRIGDMAAGTLLVYERADAHLPGAEGAVLPAARLDAAGVEIVAELLERWPMLSPAARAQLARQVLARYGGGAAESGTHSDAALRAQLLHLARPAQGPAP